LARTQRLGLTALIGAALIACADHPVRNTVPATTTRVNQVGIFKAELSRARWDRRQAAARFAQSRLPATALALKTYPDKNGAWLASTAFDFTAGLLLLVRTPRCDAPKITGGRRCCRVVVGGIIACRRCMTESPSVRRPHHASTTRCFFVTHLHSVRSVESWGGRSESRRDSAWINPHLTPVSWLRWLEQHQVLPKAGLHAAAKKIYGIFTAVIARIHHHEYADSFGAGVFSSGATHVHRFGTIPWPGASVDIRAAIGAPRPRTFALPDEAGVHLSAGAAQGWNWSGRPSQTVFWKTFRSLLGGITPCIGFRVSDIKP